MKRTVSPGRGQTAERWLLNTGAVLGSLCLLLAGLTLAFGLKPLVFTSGSMSPAIPTGSLAMAAPVPVAEVSAGDVVSVVSSSGARITHRVVSADSSSGLVLQGDANPIADLQPYTGAEVDRVLFSIPGLGYVAAWLASPWIFLLGVVLCSYLIYTAFFRLESKGATRLPRGRRRAAGGEAENAGTRRRTWRGAGALMLALAIVLPMGAAANIDSTQAAWTATAQADARLAAANMNLAGDLRCASPTSGLGRDTKVILTWSAPDTGPMPVTGYWISAYVQEPDGGPPAPDKISTERLPAGTTTQTLDQIADNGLLGNLLGALLGTLLGPNYNLKISYSVQAEYEHGWVSEPLVHSTINATSKGVLGPILPTRKLSCTLQ